MLEFNVIVNVRIKMQNFKKKATILITRKLPEKIEKKLENKYSVILNNEIWCNWYQIRETNKNKLGRCDYSGKLVGSWR